MKNFLERYSRTILLENVDFEGQERISKAKILIVGAGGISSSIIPILVASGIGEIIIWEGDSLEISNLQRQFIYKEADVSKLKVDLAIQFANELNSEIKITPIPKMLTQETLEEFKNTASEVQGIIDGTDNFASRVLANGVAISLKIPFFTGSAIGFTGHVYSFAGFKPENPCYSCLFGADIETFVDKKTCANSGVLPSMPAIIGSIIAQNLLMFVIFQNLDFSKFILVDFYKEKYFKEIIIKKDLTCKICSQH
jgi:adenylyltransferase/sulfurtransferase